MRQFQKNVPISARITKIIPTVTHSTEADSGEFGKTHSTAGHPK